jgi:DNA-3-methyladenine glycosylase
MTPSDFKKLPRSFYLRPTVTVAEDLLGKFIVRKIRGNILVGKIVETEAYCENDPASHSFRGKTKRNEVMFWEGGHLYVYFTYGMHFCSNVVTREEGIGEAVLIRAVEPIAGIETMIKNRSKRKSALTVKWRNGVLEGLTNGPARVCEAFGFGRKENGIDLLGDEIFIAQAKRISEIQIGTSSRIGIQNGVEKQWRFFVKNNSFLSR